MFATKSLVAQYELVIGRTAGREVREEGRNRKWKGRVNRGFFLIMMRGRSLKLIIPSMAQVDYIMRRLKKQTQLSIPKDCRFKVSPKGPHLHGMVTSKGMLCTRKAS